MKKCNKVHYLWCKIDSCIPESRGEIFEGWMGVEGTCSAKIWKIEVCRNHDK